MCIDTTRLRLVPYAPEHLLALMEGEATFSARSGLVPAEGLRAFVVSGEVSPDWVAELRRATAPDPWTLGFAVVYVGTGQVVGTVGFKGPPDAEGDVELGYGIVPAFEGRGLATEAAGAAVEFAFADPHVRLVSAHTLPERNASTRVLEKCGFEHRGEVVHPEDGRVWRWERTRG